MSIAQRCTSCQDHDTYSPFNTHDHHSVPSTHFHNVWAPASMSTPLPTHALTAGLTLAASCLHARFSCQPGALHAHPRKSHAESSTPRPLRLSLVYHPATHTSHITSNVTFGTATQSQRSYAYCTHAVWSTCACVRLRVSVSRVVFSQSQ